MEHIPYEKVSVKEAKESLQRNAPAPAREKNWAPFREPVRPHHRDLTEETVEWLYTVRVETRPIALALKYPRITNMIASQWRRPVLCKRYLDALLLDLRGSRNGFPWEVAQEIAALKLYLYPHLAKPHFDPWGDRIGRQSSRRLRP